MKTLNFIFFILCFILIPVFAADYTCPRTVQYSFTIQNQTNQVLKDIEFWTYAPVKRTSLQFCEKVEASHPNRIIEDEHGNQILHFTFEKLPPFSMKIISIRAFLLIAENPVALNEGGLLDYTKPARFFESDAEEIKKAAKALKTGTISETAKSIHNWIHQNIKYKGYTFEAKGALYAILNETGDCTEMTCLFVALCRAAGVPARGIGGYVCENDRQLTPYDYHNWAEFKEDGVWKISDTQKNVFSRNMQTYIAMQVISDSDNNPLETWERFKLKGKGAIVKMNKG